MTGFARATIEPLTDSRRRLAITALSGTPRRSSSSSRPVIEATDRDLVLNHEPQGVRIYRKGTFAAESGEWNESWGERGVPTELRGSYFALWRKVHGRWLLDSQVFVPLVCKGGSYCN